MGEVLSVLEACVDCCDCTDAEAAVIAGAGAVGVAAGVFALSRALGGKRPSLRYRNKKLKQYTPHPVPLFAMPPPGIDDTRFALLIGINYSGTKYELDGCVNDALRMARWLSHNSYHVLCLTDAESDAMYRPTKRNILEALQHLLDEVGDSTGNSLWLHFSGHGSQVKDESGDEADGLDETICPVDFKLPQDGEKHGMITDDVLREHFLLHIPSGNRLFAVFDCCHSGTVLDLPYYLIDAHPRRRSHGQQLRLVGDQFSSRNHVPCDAILLSSCADAQKCFDIKDVGQAFVELQHYSANGAGGALTSALLRTFEKRGSSLPLDALYTSVTHSLHEMGFVQLPQLSASKPYDLRCKFSV